MIPTYPITIKYNYFKYKNICKDNLFLYTNNKITHVMRRSVKIVEKRTTYWSKFFGQSALFRILAQEIVERRERTTVSSRDGRFVPALVPYRVRSLNRCRDAKIKGLGKWFEIWAGDRLFTGEISVNIGIEIESRSWHASLEETCDN